MPSLTFHVQCGTTRPGQSVYIVGSAPELGAWSVDQGVKNRALMATVDLLLDDVGCSAADQWAGICGGVECCTTPETFPNWTSREVTFEGEAKSLAPRHFFGQVK